MKKILIVDDHATTRQLIRWALAESGYRLYEASNGDAGISIARQVNPDLILLDVVMPGDRDGFTVCAELRADRDFSNTKIILLSANDTPQDSEKGKQAGANAYLVKPFKPTTLQSVVSRLLEADSSSRTP